MNTSDRRSDRRRAEIDYTRIDSLADDPVQRRAFDRFVALYEAAFTDPAIMEASSDWVERLGRESAPPEPVTFILLAHRRDDVRKAREDLDVLGGIVFEYYRASSTALLSYLVVDPAARRKGVGRGLVERARAVLEETARGTGRDLRGVFAETEAPEGSEDAAVRAATVARLEALRALGGKWIDVPYVQPPLGPERLPGRSLLLLAFPTGSHDALSVDRSTVLGFLEELYAALAWSSDGREELARMQDRLRRLDEAYGGEGRVPYRELPILEAPRFAFERAALTLHFVTAEARRVPPKPWWAHTPRRRPEADPTTSPRNATEIRAHVDRLRPTLDPLAHGHLTDWMDIGVTIVGADLDFDCPYFHSFEADLLSHRFQADPPLDSVCTREAPEPVTLRLPERIDYLSEGRNSSLYRSRETVRVLANLNYTRFPQTGLRVWHLTFSPDAGAAFDEYDVIKLLGTYNPHHEQTRVLEQLEFELDGESGLDVQALVHRLSGGAALVIAPRAGTLDVDTGRLEPRGPIDWEAVFAELHELRKDEAVGAEKLGELYENDGTRSLINACCGIVTGIFDFERMSLDEAIDTLVPNVPIVPELVSIQRGTLLSFGLDSGLFEDEVCQRTIGASPYLIIPHAVLLHNEVLAEQAERVTDRVADEERPEELERALETIERITRRLRVPNVFHYESERALYEVGQRNRGSGERIDALDDKIVELRHRLDTRRSVGRSRREFGLTVILGLLSTTAVLDALAFFGPDGGGSFLSFWPPNASGLVFSGAVLAVVVMMAMAFPRRG